MSHNRVLVTGLGGFTGSFVARELEQAGWDVWGLGRGAMAVSDGKTLQADLNDRASIFAALEQAKPDALIHLAAVSFVGHGRSEEFYLTNLIGTKNVLDCLHETGFGQMGVVLASSANIYGNAEQQPVPETASLHATNDYSVSKIAMEHLAGLYADKLPIVIARPFNYTGLGQNVKFLVPKIVSHFRDRRPKIELGNIEVARDFSDVRDVARAYRLMLDSKYRGQTLNICTGIATSLREVIETCAEISGHHIEIVLNKDFVRDQEIEILVGDPRRLEALCPDYRKFQFADTLRWMLEGWPSAQA